MRFAIVFGIAAFLISGSLFNAFAHDAQSVLGLAFIVSVFAAYYGFHLQHQQERATDNPGGKLYPCSKQVAFHRIKDILVSHRVGQDSWSFSHLDPESGRLMASLTFTESMSAFATTPQLPNQLRRITLTVVVTAPAAPPAHCLVQLNWMVSSPINRDNCNGIIHQLSQAIDSALAPTLVAR